ncbi:MAG TPA: DUF456 domain-containing protein [Kiritimatiellia bacterium]|jgi:uncharacterized protein YqgC (DUF456 family)|nr:DUF456 domain-containing protein [Lentisphaerota bacterium]HPC19820.1 DUF456 domain-containing protein [Kiritimatiellia bacterium]HQN80852.1 DUF456 domain-containing protein [Kiritimatiellia bacterium]HQQ61301.1 DUF456 domain-containing protein [Kiritimatiellia bacterium]
MNAAWQMFLGWLSDAGVFLGWSTCVLFCLGGLALSALSISGTWLVGVAALMAAALTGPDAFPGWSTLLGFFAVCAGVDIIEWFAASWGVRRRGGSTAAGWLALLGSLGGMVLGSLLIPVPFLGGLLGMMSGSFALVFLAERHRLRATGQAAHIAGGAVVAGLSVLFLKVMATAGLVLWLAVGLLA